MLKFLASLALVITFANVDSYASPKVSAYEKCLVRLIAARGYQYAVDHAGGTYCDRAAARK